MPRQETSPRVGDHAQARSELLTTLFSGLDTGVYVLDGAGRITAMNPAAERLLRRSATACVGVDAHDLLHRESDGSRTPRSKCALLKAYLSGQTVSQNSGTWFQRGDDTLLGVGWLSAAYQAAGEVAGAVVFFHEAGEQKDAAWEHPDTLAELESLTERLSLIAETTTVLTSTMDVDEALQRLVALVVPRLADWAVVDLLTEAGDARRVSVAHQRGGSRVRVPEMEGPLPAPPRISRMPLSGVLNGGAARLVRPEDYAVPSDSEFTAVQQKLAERTRMRSAIIAPLRGPRAVLGALTLIRGDTEPPFTASDLALLDDVARRAGLAVDNARLYNRQRHVAETMQLHLLPPLPTVDGLAMAARYLPSPHGSQVGGDWYDVFLLPDGVTTLVVGDVAGHDLQAAARMSQLRNMLRAFAWDRQDPPSLIVSRLDNALPHISDAPTTTLVLARVEGKPGGPWQLHWTNAGHPPPLLITPQQQVRYLGAENDALLGTEMPVERHDSVEQLPSLSTVLLYTDGLVESSDLPLSEGLRRLEEQAAALADRPLNDFCDELIRRCRPSGHEDDIAVLALRIPQRFP